MCQDSVFSLFQDSQKAGDNQFAAGNYTQAISLYTALLTKDPDNVQTQQKLAQAYYKAKDYAEAVNIYNRYMASGQTLTATDMYYYAEANATLGRRAVALDYYKRCLAKQPDNDLLTKKNMAIGQPSVFIRRLGALCSSPGSRKHSGERALRRAL